MSREPLTQTVIALAAGILLLWGLTGTYLWQDEAATAVLARNMLRFGTPRTYDGTNLITIDRFAAEDPRTIDTRTASAKAAVDYYVARGDVRPDTAWIFQPWGQFVVAAAGMSMLGATTLGARLPFALAGLLTVLLLYRLARRSTQSWWIAVLSCSLLVFNTYWVLHARQARYYSLSTLLLVTTLIAYTRWQRGERWGEAGFVAAAWCWFQVDYGTVWPVLGVLVADALVGRRRKPGRIAAVCVALAVSIAPFVVFYRLAGRGPANTGPWLPRFQGHLFNVNLYVVPVLLLAIAIALLARRWKSVPEEERSLLRICCCLPVAVALWASLVAPASFVRYVIMLAPVGGLVGAWTLVRLAGARRSLLAAAGAAILIVTPWVSLPAIALLFRPAWSSTRSVVRAELSLLAREVFGSRPDPNRIVVEWLREHAAPTDEILVNYEDVPLMYYLPNPIRGGIAAFRVEDDSKGPPRYAVLRESVGWSHWPVFSREINRYQWETVPLPAPDIPWGNNPDPIGHQQDPASAPPLFLARRIGP